MERVRWLDGKVRAEDRTSGGGQCGGNGRGEERAHSIGRMGESVNAKSREGISHIGCCMCGLECC